MEYIRFDGRVRFHAIVARDYNDDLVRDWLRMSESERARCASDIAEFHNVLTTAGRTYLLTFTGASSPPGTAFAQYFAIGTTAIVSVFPGDTSVPGEFYRVANGGDTITGTQVDITFSIPSGSGNATYTNIGLFGNGASGTLGSGELHTHALSNFVKTSANALQVDYLVNLQ